MPYPLLTDRLLITPLTGQDVAAFVAYRQDAEVARFQGWEPTYSELDAGELLASQPTAPVPESGNWLQLALRDNETAELLGDVALHTVTDFENTFEIGVTVARASQRQGIAAEAVGRVLTFLFEEAGAHRVVATCDSRNEAIGRLLGEIGLRKESSQIECEFFKGEWVTLDGYAIRRSEFSTLC